MVAFNILGDWSWTGDTTFTGAVTAHGTDIQMEASGTARLDNAFGASGDVEIANSNATHLQLGNTFCAVDLACTDYTLNSGGAVNLHSSVSVDLDAPTVGIAGTFCTTLNIGHAATTWVASANVFGLTSANGMTFTSGTGMTLNTGSFLHLGVGSGVTSTTIGNVTATTNVNINSDQLNVFSVSTIDIECVGSTQICTSSGTSLDVGNPTCAWTTSGTSWGGTYSGLVDLQSSNEVHIHCENGGNSCEVDLFNDGSVTIGGTGTMILASLAIEINVANTNPVSISNVTGVGTINLNAATIVVPNLPGTPPVGSLAVMWDPVGFQFYHV